jgi:hypothetical protein
MNFQSIDVGSESVSAERRATRREVMICRVGLLHSTTAQDFCRIVNISAGGFMARVYHEIAVGDEVKIELKTGQLLAGQVAWAKDEHVGVEFRDLVDIEAALSNRHISNSGYLPRLPRIEVDYRMRLRWGSRYYTGRLRDISQSGAQVQTSGLLSPAASVAFMLRDLPSIPATVRWTKGTRAGLSFNESVPLEPLVRWIQNRRAEWPHIAGVEADPAPQITTRLRRKGCGNG